MTENLNKDVVRDILSDQTVFDKFLRTIAFLFRLKRAFDTMAERDGGFVSLTISKNVTRY